MAEALALVEQAIDRDPQYGPALAWAAWCCVRLVSDHLSCDPEADRARASRYARQALKVAPDDPGALAHAAFALGYLGEDIDAMIALVDRALGLNPSYARGWNVAGYLRGLAGDTEGCIEHLETALRLSPRARVGTTFLLLGGGYFFSKRFAEALPKLHLAIQEDPTHPFALRVLAACYAHMGRIAEARQTVERLRALTTALIGTMNHVRNPEHRELLVSGLRLAAGETWPHGGDETFAPSEVPA
jgi:adenylate cyclase